MVGLAGLKGRGSQELAHHDIAVKTVCETVARSKLKFAVYNLLEKLLGRDLVWRVGRFLYLGARRELSLDPQTDGEYQLQSWLVQECKAKQTGSLSVFDVGANLGWWSENLVDLVSPNSSLRLELLGFEPAPDQRKELEARFDRIAKDNIKLDISSVALSDYEGEAKFHITGPKTGTSHLFANNHAAENVAGKVISVDVTTVDLFMEKNGVEKIDFMKIDTEGNDFRVIKGAEKALQRQAIGLIQFEYSGEWIDHGHSIKAVMEFAAAHKYRFGRLTQNFVEQYDTWHPELDRYILSNFVLLSPAVCLPADRIKNYTMNISNTAREVRN